MKKAALTTLLAVFSLSLAGFCPIVTTLSNGSIPCASGLSPNSTDIHAYLWIQGKADWTTNGTNLTSVGYCVAGMPYGGCDSDGVDIMDESCLLDGTSILGPWDLCASGNPGEYYLFTDWGAINYDGCPSNDSSERAILLIYDDDGKYVLQSRSQGKDWDNWDEIGTSAAQYFNRSYSFEWNYDANGPFCRLYFYGGNDDDYTKYGAYSSGDAPLSPLVTGFRIYYYNRCGDPYSSPENLSTAAWVPGPIYPINTSEVVIRPSDFPISSSDGVIVSQAYIVDGMELPRVSTYGQKIYEAIPEVLDYLPCECGIHFPTDWYSPYGPYYASGILGSLEVFEDGVSCSPWDDCMYWFPSCGEEHTFSYRNTVGNWTQCWQTWTFNKPSNTAITSIVDNDPNSNTGVTVNFTPTVPASRHDLYIDGVLAKTGILPSDTYNGLDCNNLHNFQIAAQVDWHPPWWGGGDCTTYWSNIVSASDGCVGAPGELALGANSDDALVFSNDETTASWPSFTGATGYRLYRGTQADLQNLPGGAVDNSCLRYDGTSTNIDLSGDTPATESFCWYLVTAYNGAGEGPAGTGRIINSSGACP
ncbi:MAG TPA: hypothetical protein PK747_04215 [Acidobacteriota bacterium]|nr:hypothetical protein [Acidobacteriota bacterium]HQQ46597.1 hypothetical protein [Acidobacteriota bacterium]